MTEPEVPPTNEVNDRRPTRSQVERALAVGFDREAIAATMVASGWAVEDPDDSWIKSTAAAGRFANDRSATRDGALGVERRTEGE